MEQFTEKANECLKKAVDLATETGHGLLTTLHVAVVLFEDEEGVAPQAVLKIGNQDTLRSVSDITCFCLYKVVLLPAQSLLLHNMDSG